MFVCRSGIRVPFIQGGAGTIVDSHGGLCKLGIRGHNRPIFGGVRPAWPDGMLLRNRNL
jgi:hypothetical protein